MGLIKTSQPALHGDQHLCEGSDPIPGICGLFPNTGGATFDDYVRSLSNLVGYWRLGEGASPFADTSGFAPSDPADLTVVTRGAAYDPDEPGALTIGDDGAVKFTSNGTAGDYLRSTESAPEGRFDFASGTDFTVSAWVKVLADTGSFTGQVVGNLASSPATGWSLGVVWPARTVFFSVQDVGGTYHFVASPSLVAGVWYLLTATKGGLPGIELFVNGVSVAAGAGASTLPAWHGNLKVGGGHPNASDDLYFYGWIDEVAIWNAVLTDDEIAGLYTTGVSTEFAAEDMVLTSDGAGGTSYAYPTVNVDGTRYDEILTGTGLTSTDNTDGTVTLDATGGGAPTGTAGGVLDGTYPNPGLAATVAGAGLAETSPDVLSVNVDNSTLEISSDTVRVKASGIGPTEIASTTVTPGSYGDATHVGQFTVDADGRLTAASNVTISAATFDPATATTWWFPLADSDGTLVLDDNGDLIPTLIPL